MDKLVRQLERQALMGDTEAAVKLIKYTNYALTENELRNLPINTVIYHGRVCNVADGTPLRVRISGKVKEWKRNPKRWRLPIKFGLYESAYLGSENEATCWLDQTMWYKTEEGAVFSEGK